MTSWREHQDSPEDEELAVTWQDRGTVSERAIGWVLTYPVRTMIIMFVLVLFLTLICGL